MKRGKPISKNGRQEKAQSQEDKEGMEIECQIAKNLQNVIF